MNNILKNITIATTIIMTILLNIVYICINGFYINTVFLLLLLTMFLNPILNFIKVNKNIILNPIYNFLLIASNAYMIYICFNCIKLGITSYTEIINHNMHNINYIYNAKEYLNSNLLYMMILVIFMLVLSFLFKKKEEKRMINNIVLIFVLINSIITEIYFQFFSYDLYIIPEAATIATLLWLAFKDKLNDNIKETTYFLILFILNIFTLNPITIVITFYIYIQYKKGLIGYTNELN